MRRFLILLAALALLAGEPAVAPPVPALELTPPDVGLIPRLLYRLEHPAGMPASLPVR